MMKGKTRVLGYSFQFQEMFLSKDIFLVPYYIAKCLGGTLDYIYCKNLGNTIIPTVHRNANIRQSTIANDFRAMLKYIVFDAKQVDVLFIWGSSLKHMFIIRMFKLLNPKAKVVVFGDMEPPQARTLNQTDFMCPKGVNGIVKRYFTNFFMTNVTYIVANTEAYNEMRKLCERNNWNGLLHFYPCLDDEKFREYGIKRKSWEEKENIMVCVGRVGCDQKNTEMLLEALKKVDLKDWKIYLIGPITSSFDLNEKGEFQNIIDWFFKEYPQYNDKLIFTGMIYDQRIVMDYYNRAKVLLMTSRHESWGNVYSEAAALGCYIISTDVGGAKMCSNDWQFGTKVPQEDSEQLAGIIQRFIDAKIVVSSEKSIPFNSLLYSIMMRNVLLPKLGYMPKY